MSVRVDVNDRRNLYVCLLYTSILWRIRIGGGSRCYIGHLTQSCLLFKGRLCGLVIRVPGYRSRGPGFDSRRYQIFWEVVGLEWGPLNLVRITEELLDWKSSESGSRKLILSRGDQLRWLCDIIYPQKLAITSPTSGRSVGIVRLRTKDTEFSFLILLLWYMLLY
jgi:hypothetical protein